MTDTELHLAQAMPNLADGWYVAVASAKLRRRPRRVLLFGEEFVAWRTRRGVAAVLPATCPHMGAALYQGRVVNDTVQCPFHQWRFDASGRCVAVPGRRPPARAAAPSAPAVVESSGYIWVWWGSSPPTHQPPTVPALARWRPLLHRFQLADPTRGTVRRILENTFDPDHLVALHGLTVSGHTSITWHEVDRSPADDTPAADSEARPVRPVRPERLDATLSWPAYAKTLGRVSSLLGLNAEVFELRVQGWATCQRIEYFADGRRVYDMVLATTPINPDRYVQHINVAVDREGRGPAAAVRALVHRAEVTVAARQDLPIFNTLLPGDRHGIYVAGDEAVRRFRRFYQQWVASDGGH